MDRENLGPAERIIQTLLAHTDHMFHNRPGYVTPAPGSVLGVQWQPAVTKKSVDKTLVLRLDKRGVGKKAKTIRTEIGALDADKKTIRSAAGQKIGEFREPGIFPEVAVWAYNQVAEVWKLDNEFAARWASYAFADKQTARDFKVVLAAFMLVQARKGDPIRENGQVAFHDDDFRDVGEAMVLTQRKKGEDFNVKLLLRIREVLELPQVAETNRTLGFGRSERSAHLGRWLKAAARWLRFRERNPKVLEGLVKSGFRSSVIKLAKAVGYKPETPNFFKVLRWEQAQASDGRRGVAIGEKLEAAETWAGLTEMQVCERIVRDKPNFKRIVGLVPSELGLTRAIVAAAVEAGSFSNKDLIIFAPTLEELGLLQVQEVREKFETALRLAEDQRAANVARNVQSKELKDKLEEGADNAVKAAVAEVVRGLRIYFMVDISSSMQGAIDQAKKYIEKFLGGFPADQIHISVFNTTGREIKLKAASAAGVQQAFKGIAAGGGTDYGAGVRVLQAHKPKADEDVLFIFIGDEGHNGIGGGHGGHGVHFAQAIQASGLNPMAIGLVPVVSPQYGRANAVRTTAGVLGVPCLEIDQKVFEDPYAIPRTLRALIAATPVGQANVMAAAPARVSLVDTIMKTELLKKPVWAAVEA